MLHTERMTTGRRGRRLQHVAQLAVLVFLLTGLTSAEARSPARPPTAAVEAAVTSSRTADPLRGELRAPAGVISRNGSQLVLDGKPYFYVGFAAPQISTLWSVNWGCGKQTSDAELEAFMSGLPKNSLLSVTAMQAMAFNNKTTFALDFTPIDRIMNAALRHGHRLNLGLASQSGDCSDGHWKDAAWYAGGYKKRFNDDGRNLERLSFWDYLHVIVARYRAHPALGMWGLVGEPESSNCAKGFRGAACYGRLTCPKNAGAVLRTFYDVVGAELKKVDPVHLLMSGTIGSSQCGTFGADYANLHASPAIDLVEIHEYDADDEAMPAGHADAATLARQLGKPVIVGENGIRAGSASGCKTAAQRRDALAQKISTHFIAGYQGYTIWQWSPAVGSACTYEVTPGDPSMQLAVNSHMTP